MVFSLKNNQFGGFAQLKVSFFLGERVHESSSKFVLYIANSYLVIYMLH